MGRSIQGRSVPSLWTNWWSQNHPLLWRVYGQAMTEVQSQVCEATVEQELTCWGHSCSDFCFGEHDTFLCFSNDFVNDLVYHYMFYHSHVPDEQGCIKHSQSFPMTTPNALKFLDALGYARALVLSEEHLGKNIHPSAVHFNASPAQNKNRMATTTSPTRSGKNTFSNQS